MRLKTTSRLYGGFGTSLEFYGFDLSVQFAYQFGGKIWDYTYQDLMHNGDGYGAGENWHKDIANAWTPENRITDVPRLDYMDQYTNSSSDRWLVSSNYLSVNNITLGYNFPKAWLRGMGINSLRVYTKALSIQTPINGSFSASQMVQIITRVPNNFGSTPSALVQ